MNAVQQANGLDERDTGILLRRAQLYNQLPGPRVGDFVLLKGEANPRRFTHDWDDSIQTTPLNMSGSFYLGDNKRWVDAAMEGHLDDRVYISYSGGLDPSIKKTGLWDTGQFQDGSIWFFHHDCPGAGCGVDASMPFRVFAVNALRGSI